MSVFKHCPDAVSQIRLGEKTINQINNNNNDDNNNNNKNLIRG